MTTQPFKQSSCEYTVSHSYFIGHKTRTICLLKWTLSIGGVYSGSVDMEFQGSVGVWIVQEKCRCVEFTGEVWVCGVYMKSVGV